MRLIALISVALCSASCATSTVILSDPPGASVSYHGRELGQTPLDYSSEDWIWEDRELEVSAPGYHARTLHLRRERINPPLAIISGAVFMFACWPLGLGMFLAGGMDYPDEVYVRLRPLRSAQTPLPPPSPPPTPHQAVPPVPDAPPSRDESVPY